jgi:hypothetical protein
MLCVAAMAVVACGGGDGDGAEPPVAPARGSVAPQRAVAALDVNTLLDWAEQRFPTLFPGHPGNSTLGVYTYRAYASGNFAGTGDGGVYILGPSLTGGALVRLGALADFTCQVRASVCTAAGTTVGGTVMGKGVALASAVVTLRDALGATRTATTNASGSYTIDASGLAPPFVASASGSVNGAAALLVAPSSLRSLSGAQRINLTPWTTALAAMISPTGRAADLSATAHATLIETRIVSVTNYSRTLIAPSLSAAGVSPTSYDPVGDALAADGGGMQSLYTNLTVGTTPSTNAVFMADANASPCSAAQLGGCVRYSDPPAQTTTNPNACGSDIATGVTIPCDASLPLTATPSPIAIDPSQAYQFGCIGCVFWGPADDYTAAPTQTPLTVNVAAVGSGSGAGSEVWQATFSATACAAGFCASAGSTTSGQAYSAQDVCQQAAAVLAQTLNAAAVPGLTYSFSCKRIA